MCIRDRDVFDRKAFAESPMDFYVGCTNVETGKPEYILLDTMDEIDYMRASASMPMVSQIVCLLYTSGSYEIFSRIAEGGLWEKKKNQ